MLPISALLDVIEEQMRRYAARHAIPWPPANDDDPPADLMVGIDEDDL